jgi:hypothetical protein
MRRRAFISLVGGTMVASKQGEEKMNRIALAGVLLMLAVPATAGPDALGCFTRTYDRAHLAQHPDQVVTAVKLRIHRPPRGNADKYWFLAQFRLRGKDETLRTNGICNDKASGLRCSVECDGGGVDVVPRARDATMHLDRISGPACDEDSAQELTGGKDDRVFRLDRVNDAACAGMKP